MHKTDGPVQQLDERSEASNNYITICLAIYLTIHAWKASWDQDWIFVSPVQLFYKVKQAAAFKYGTVPKTYHQVLDYEKDVYTNFIN